jgi:hypothetical protein
VFIRVHPRPKKFGGFRGALLRARAEFGVKGDKALFLTLGTRTVRHFLFRVHLCLSVSHWVSLFRVTESYSPEVKR